MLLLLLLVTASAAVAACASGGVARVEQIRTVWFGKIFTSFT